MPRVFSLANSRVTSTAPRGLAPAGVVGWYQQLGITGSPGRFLEQFVDVRFTVSDADPSGIGTKRLDFPDPMVTPRPTIAFFFLDGG